MFAQKAVPGRFHLAAGTRGRLLIAFFFASALPVVTIAVHRNASGAPPPSPFSSNAAATATAAALGLAMLAAYLALLSAKGKRSFMPAAFSVAALEIVLTTGLGLVHQDYSVHWFQLVCAFMYILNTRLDLIVPERSYRGAARTLFSASLLLFLAMCVWIMIAGFSIVSRIEPRLNESIWYNSYNAIFIPVQAVAILRLRTEGYRTVRLGVTGFSVDGHDFSGYLGAVNAGLAREFLGNAGAELNCAALVSSVNRGIRDNGDSRPDRLDAATDDLRDLQETGNPGDDPNDSATLPDAACAGCLVEPLKATGCRTYRKVYKRVNDIRKLFEALEIGTVLNPDNKMKIVERGWKLRLFDDVRVVDDRFGR
ncbi:MAG: hypothetical protein NT080_01920 [Spirochaetes bacterium]|nr:hypothetical protein [Spirochaetota bacterium]